MKVDKEFKKQVFGWICKQQTAMASAALPSLSSPQGIILACSQVPSTPPRMPPPPPPHHA
jgi:hypothetical protein